MPKELVEEDLDPDFYEIPRTLPDSLTESKTQFLVFGDTQTGWRAEHKFYRSENWFTWKHLMFPFYQIYLLGNALVGAANWGRATPDYGYWSREFMSETLYEAAQQINADFALFLGDAADDGRRADHWEMFLNDYGPLLRNYPVLPTPGNHAYVNTEIGQANYQAVFDYPFFYVQDMPEAALFVLNSNYLIDQHGNIDDQKQDRLWERWFVSADTSSNLSWLERQLKRRKDRPYKIVAMHHPPVSFSWHLEDWYEPVHGNRLLEKRQQLLSLFQKYNVQVIFGGHEHVYEHNLLRYQGDDPNVSRMHQIISSGGGTPPRKMATPGEMERRQELYEEQDMDVVLVKQKSAFHYTTVTIVDAQMTIETFEVGAYGEHETSLLERVIIPHPDRPLPPSSSSEPSAVEVP